MKTVLLAGSGHPDLASKLAAELKLPLETTELGRFPDGELTVAVPDIVRRSQVFILQGLHPPLGERLMELALIADSCRRQGAEYVTAVVPYLGYARQDRRDRPSQPLGARVAADLLSATAISCILCLDLHTRALEGCFTIQVEHASAESALIEAVRASLVGNEVIVSPDLGAVKRAETFARQLGLPVAVVHKQRISGEEVIVHGVVGEVRGLRPILVDDLISTGNTLAAAAQALLRAGAKGPISAVATHGLFCGDAHQTLGAVPIEHVYVTDSVPGDDSSAPFRIHRVPCAKALASRLRVLAALEAP